MDESLRSILKDLIFQLCFGSTVKIEDTYSENKSYKHVYMISSNGTSILESKILARNIRDSFNYMFSSNNINYISYMPFPSFIYFSTGTIPNKDLAKYKMTTKDLPDIKIYSNIDTEMYLDNILSDQDLFSPCEKNIFIGRYYEKLGLR